MDTLDSSRFADFVDLDYCFVQSGSSYTAFVLMQDGVRYLWELAGTLGGNHWVRSTSEIDADHVACRSMADGSIVATVSEDGWVKTWSQGPFGQSMVEVSSTNLGMEVGDLGIWDPDGSGPVPVTCEGECSLVVGDLDRDGFDELVVRDSEGITLTGWGESVSLGAGPGLLSLADIDGDDRLDVIASDPDSGSIRAWRSVGAGVAPALSWHTRQPIGSAAMIGDVNGDGTDELIFQSQNGTLLYSKPSGT